jgi:hypothetical protein
MRRTRKEVFVVIVVDECFGDYALFDFCMRAQGTQEIVPGQQSHITEGLATIHPESQTKSIR